METYPYFPLIFSGLKVLKKCSVLGKMTTDIHNPSSHFLFLSATVTGNMLKHDLKTCATSPAWFFFFIALLLKCNTCGIYNNHNNNNNQSWELEKVETSETRGVQAHALPPPRKKNVPTLKSTQSEGILRVF